MEQEFSFAGDTEVIEINDDELPAGNVNYDTNHFAVRSFVNDEKDEAYEAE